MVELRAMYSWFSMFGRSPFAPLKAHMDIVSQCVAKIEPLCQALDAGHFARMKEISEEIYQIENQADLAKHDVRNHLPKSLFLPFDRSWLLEVIEMQDKIADKVEDLAVVLEMKPLHLFEALREPFFRFLNKNLEAFRILLKIYDELKELMETSFGGLEAETVRTLVDEVALKEHEADIIQTEILKVLFNSESQLTFTSFDLWQKVFGNLAALSNISENLADRIRMLLELK